MNPGRRVIKPIQVIFQSENLASDRAARGENPVSAEGAAYVVEERKRQLRTRNKMVSLI
jgi:hypothetical protein